MNFHPAFTSGRTAVTQSSSAAAPAAPAAQKNATPRAKRGNRIVAAPSLAPEMPDWATQATQTDVSLRRAIRRMVEKQFACILAKDLGTDPILGDWFAGTSIASKIQKAHGALLPRALGMALESKGLKVWYEPVISLSAMSLALSKGNTIPKLDGLSLPPCGADRTLYAVDLVVHCPKTGWTVGIDGKRGGGQSDSTAKSEMVEYIRATYLFLPTWARENGLDVRAHDARVIDFYGRSSYDDELAIRGWQLDAYFGCDVEAMLAWFNACFREAADEVLKRLQERGNPGAIAINRGRTVVTSEGDWFRAPNGSGVGNALSASGLFNFDFDGVGANAIAAELPDPDGADNAGFSRYRASRAAALARYQARLHQ